MTMGRLGHLPAAMGRIHPLTRTPIVSLIVVGAAILFFSMSLGLEDLAHYADTVLLIALILVNAALIVHRRRYPDMERPFRVPLVPLLPAMGIVANLYLMAQLIHHPVPMGLALGTLALGGGAFLVWRRLSPGDEAAAPTPTPAPERSADDRYRVLVPISNPATAQALLKLAAAIAADRDGEVVIARVVVVPEQVPMAELDVLRRETRVLQQAETDAADLGVPLVPVVTIGHDVAQAIQSVARSRHCDLVLLGWKGFSTTRERILGEITDSVVSQARCDIMVVKPVGGGALERVLLPTAGGEHAERALEYAATLSRRHGTQVTVATVVRPGQDTSAAQALVDAAAAGVDGDVGTRLLVGDSIEDTIVEAGASFDAIVIGATGRNRYKGMLFGTIPEAIARHSARTVIVVKRVD
jgi:nucleotide-binding universal stress UspA family protein